MIRAYNSMVNDSSEYSPYWLMFGREAQLPVDLAFGTSLDYTSQASYRGYVDRLRRSLKTAYEKVKEASFTKSEGSRFAAKRSGTVTELGGTRKT